MVSVSEISGSQSALESAFRQGLESIDRGQQITFQLYTKTVLPADGYVFWVAAGSSICVDGSLHYAVEEQQNETETQAVNHVIFTAEREVQEFNVIAPNQVWIGSLESAVAGPPLQSNQTPFPIMFAFSGRGNFYKQADVYHYRGIAILPTMMSQIINSASDLPADPIVSNSLPIWLSQTQFGTVYPSFLVPNNIEPPYIVAHIGEEDTSALAPLPFYGIGPNPSEPPNPIPGQPGFSYPTSDQLMVDRVRLTLYGFNNQQALAYRDYLLNYSLTTDAFGVCRDDPVLRDAKLTQREIGVIAQKKTLDMTVSYYQSAVSDLAVRLITSVAETFNFPN
jgi:hypothetical protein